ncbi:MAG: hypothetical protein ABS38_06550 [Acidovorax sp. SCN 68-22]|nr:MAG: hypothetical protein ABS38_06550 [Acidovorax sp. SCN 68-22]
MAALSSRVRWLTKPCATSSRLRWSLARAIDTSACACATCARGSWSSSCTSSAPLRTRWPSRNPRATTRPATSGRSTTLFCERRLPTACTLSTRSRCCTVATSTLTAERCHHHAAAPATHKATHAVKSRKLLEAMKNCPTPVTAKNSV